MNLLLIHPPLPANQRHKRVLPLSLGYIASYLRNNIKTINIEILDAHVLNIGYTQIIKEFSKRLAIAVSCLYFFVILFSLIVWYIDNRIPSEILGSVGAPFGVVISGYFVKAGFENWKKIETDCREEQIYYEKI